MPIYDDIRNASGEWQKNTTPNLCKQGHTRAGRYWQGILKRSSGKDQFSKNHPTYSNCVNEFSGFQEFAEWAMMQPGYGLHDAEGRPWQIDKDILIFGSKSYSPETCCFVPKSINNILTFSNARRGIFPLGVRICAGKFVANICIDGKLNGLGRFNSKDIAHRAWQTAKIMVIERAAESLDDSHFRAKNGLMGHADRIREDLLHGRETIRGNE